MLVKKKINSHCQGRKKTQATKQQGVIQIFLLLLFPTEEKVELLTVILVLVEQLVFIFKHEIAIACCFPSCFPCTSQNIFMYIRKSIMGKQKHFQNTSRERHEVILMIFLILFYF